MKKASPPPPYPLEADVEAACVLASCGEPRFYQAVGRAIDAARLRDSSAQLLMAAAHAITAKAGQPPSWPSLCVQHLATLMSQGKVTVEQLEHAKDYLLEAMARPSVHADELIASIAPVVQRVLHKEAVESALDDYKNRHDPGETAAAFEAVSKVGKVQSSEMADISVVVEQDKFFDWDDEPRLKLGVPELDDALEGGLERNALGLLVGSSGAGKSMALAHAAVEAVLSGHDVMYVTLELSVRRVTQRLTRNLIDMTKREAALAPDEARRRFRAVMGQGGTGRFIVAYLEPIVSSPKDVRRAVEQAMRDHRGFEPDGLFVDFIDKLRVNPRASLYEDMLAVTDGLRSIVQGDDLDGWCWTASQSDRKSTNRPWLDLDAVADSMNKVRSADLVVAVGRTEEDKQQDLVRFSVPKRREGEGAHARIGPIGWDPEHGRICVVSDRSYPW